MKRWEERREIKVTNEDENGEKCWASDSNGETDRREHFCPAGEILRVRECLCMCVCVGDKLNISISC